MPQVTSSRNGWLSRLSVVTPTASRLAAKVLLISRIRTVVAASAFTYALAMLVFDQVALASVNLPEPVFVLLLPFFILAYNQAGVAVIRRDHCPSAALVGLTGDLLAVTIGLVGTGGISSWLWALYPFVTLEAAFLSERLRWTVAAAIAGTLLYTLALTLEHQGVVPPIPTPLVAERMLPGAYLVVKASWVAGLNAAAALAGVVTLRGLNEARARLEAAYDRLDEQYKALSELDRLKSTFLSVVSHELRTPIQILRGYTELVEEDAGLSDASRRYLAQAEASTRALTDKINLMIDYSALANDARPLHQEEVPVAELLHSAAERMAAPCREAGLVLFVSPPGEELVVAASGPHLVEALAQLLENACQATPKGGTVRLRAGVRDGMLELAVDDEGPGLPEAVRASVGKPFIQPSSRLTEHKPGLGLGLAYAQLVARRHGGSLVVRDRPQGGTTAALRLPERLVSRQDPGELRMSGAG